MTACHAQLPLAADKVLDCGVLATLAAAICAEETEWRELLGLQAANVLALAARAQSAWHDQHDDAMRRALHTLQGSAAQFGLDALAGLCAEAGRASRSGDTTGLTAVMGALSEAAAEAAAALQRHGAPLAYAPRRQPHETPHTEELLP